MIERDNPLEGYLAKIESRRPLSQDARDAFLALPVEPEHYDIYREIVREDDRTSRCCLIIQGCVSRFKTLPNGERQINSFHFDNDMVDLQSALLLVSDHGIRTHSPTTVLRIDCNAVLQLTIDQPEWAHAFWFDTLVDAAVFREWMLNVGRRVAVGRVGHLILEIFHKLSRIGRTEGYKFVMPITQNDLADAVGLSAVHTNRSLQQLREHGMISSIGRTFSIDDFEAMKRLSSFDPAYLHPAGPRVVNPECS
ncbi:Crp/Fnr family transcriptional regulator [Erythrobacter litoralis]|uniref:Crp/Fnr family transcriptional regulator n=1 Tax=Erythrobacter litoralis TaxID=39960 RepID=UPI002435BB82|nr:Crp/Fnr family transcriptional regulator [Erythrobacter litoralis]MDG6078506.1 Crp/Fnr family transcriptional regulator [Erythrobacter litoralis]